MESRSHEVALSTAQRGIRAQNLLKDRVLGEAFGEITEDFIKSIFTAKESQSRDRIAFMKQGVDILFNKLKEYSNTHQLEVEAEEMEKKAKKKKGLDK